MLLNLLLGALLHGPSTCPTPAQVDAHLGPDAARRLVVEVSEQTDGVHLALRDPAGLLLTTRVVAVPGDCDARAQAVASVIRDFGPARRVPLGLGRARPAPPFEPPAPDPLEIVAEAGAVMSPAPIAFVGRAWAVLSPGGGALTVPVGLELVTPVTVAKGVRAWQLGLALGVGLRHGLGGVTIDAFATVPLSVLATPTPSFVLNGLFGARFTLGDLRLAPVVQIALEVPLVKPVALDIPTAALTITVGMRGGVW